MSIYKSELVVFANKVLRRKYSTAKVITAASKESPCNVEAVAHGYSTGDEIWIKDAGGMTEINNLHFTVTYVDADNFTIGVDSSAYTLYTSGGESIRDDIDIEIVAALKDLSKRGNFLTEESTRSSVDERPYYSLPLHYKDNLVLVIDDYYMLTWETFKKYQLEYSINSTDEGYPKFFSKNNKFYYLRPYPDSNDYTIRQFFACYHPETITVDSVEYKACDYILFDDIYRKALEMRLVWEIAINLGRYKTAAEWMGYYLKDEIPSLLLNVEEDPTIANYPSLPN